MDRFIDKNNPNPLYSQISDWIREKVYSGEWQTNQQLPAEEELAQTLNVSRGTLKKAISFLVKEGLLIQIHGKGTFVGEPKVSQPFGQELISFAESMVRKGLSFDTKVIEQGLEHPKKSVQEKLGIAAEEQILFLKRVRNIDDEPVIFMENYINAAICKGIQDADFTKTTLFSEMERRSQKKIDYGVRTFEARAIEEDQAKWLSLPEGYPVLYLDQLVYLEGNIPIETSKVWLRSDKYVITSLLNR